MCAQDGCDRPVRYPRSGECPACYMRRWRADHPHAPRPHTRLRPRLETPENRAATAHLLTLSYPELLAHCRRLAPHLWAGIPDRAE